MNILGFITQFLTPSTVGQFATMIGAGPDTVEKALGAAVPGILSGLIGLSGTKQGADSLTELIAAQGSGGFESLSTLMGSDPKGAATAGAEALSSIFGGGRVGVMASKLKDYAGLPEGTSGAMLGAAGSVIMAALGQAGAATGDGAAGALRLLRDQKDEIFSALPEDFSKSLRGAGLIDDLVAEIKPVQETVRLQAAPDPEPVRQAPRVQAQRVVEPVAAPVSSNFWLWPVLGGLVALGLLWAFFGRSTEEVTDKTVDAESAAKQSLTVDGVDIGSGITSALEGITASLASVKDVVTAQAALPQLQEIAGKVSGFGPIAAKLPEADRGQLKSLIDAALPTLRASADKLLADTGISGILKPVLDPILASLGSLAG
jgi:hypothetical protein